MKYYLYMSSDCKTTMDDLLTFIDVLDINDPESFQTQIVKYFLRGIFQNRTLPYFIELSIQNYVNRHFSISSHLSYAPAVNFDEYYQSINYIINSQDHLEELFRLWTEEEEYPLVIVCESDKCASFLLKQFPPIERFIQ
jgi:hypothetical protein